jgi:hypothetical protein
MVRERQRESQRKRTDRHAQRPTGLDKGVLERTRESAREGLRLIDRQENYLYIISSLLHFNASEENEKRQTYRSRERETDRQTGDVP